MPAIVMKFYVYFLSRIECLGIGMSEFYACAMIMSMVKYLMRNSRTKQIGVPPNEAATSSGKGW